MNGKFWMCGFLMAGVLFMCSCDFNINNRPGRK